MGELAQLDIEALLSGVPDETRTQLHEALIEDLRVNLPQVRQALRHMPVAVRQIAEQASTGNVRIDLESPEVKRIRSELAGQRE